MIVSDRLKNKLENIPELPGIYKMYDSRGNIIYIGKSISLRNRVRSYFTGNHKWSKIEKMVTLINDLEYEVMDTHLEARLEECKLIKEIRPIFNSQFKNDSKYVYLKVEDYNIHNPLSIIYSREENSFGAFRSRSNLMEIIDSFKNLYPIRKNDNGYDFEYNFIPVTMDKDQFNINKECLIEILSNDINLTIFINELKEKMKEASTLLKFERAAYYKNMMDKLDYLMNRMSTNKNNYYGEILLKIPTQKGFKLFFIYNGEIILKESYIELFKADIDDFIRRGKVMIPSEIKDINEKTKMDFIDILFSEIQTLPKDMVMYI